MVRYRYHVLLFQLIWNRVPTYMESCSDLYGIAFQLIWNTTLHHKARCKGIRMAFVAFKRCCVIAYIGGGALAENVRWEINRGEALHVRMRARS